MDESDIKIKPTETVIDSNWWIEANHLTREEAREVSHRIYLLATNYLKKIVAVEWEILYQDPEDHRYWEWTYPVGYWGGMGSVMLRCLTKEEAEAKYNIKL